MPVPISPAPPIRRTFKLMAQDTASESAFRCGPGRRPSSCRQRKRRAVRPPWSGAVAEVSVWCQLANRGADGHEKTRRWRARRHCFECHAMLQSAGECASLREVLLRWRTVVLIVESIDSLDGLRRLESKWRRLCETAGDLPFLSWEWNVSWWMHLSRQGLRVKDRLYVRTVSDHSGELVAVAPLMLTEMPSRGPLRFRCLQFFGADPNITELRGVLCRPDMKLPAYRALLEHLFERSGDWDWIVWDGIPRHSDVDRLMKDYAPHSGGSRDIKFYTGAARDMGAVQVDTIPQYQGVASKVRQLVETGRPCRRQPGRRGRVASLTMPCRQSCDCTRLDPRAPTP